MNYSISNHKLNYLTFFIIITAILLPLNSYCLSPETKLANEKQEERAMNLFLQVRCLVCNGQVIENSDTEFSFEMRKLIRKKISQGDSDQEIKNYLIKEFGNDILTDVTFKGKNDIILWVFPFIFSIFLFLFLFIKKQTFLNKKF